MLSNTCATLILIFIIYLLLKVEFENDTHKCFRHNSNEKETTTNDTNESKENFNGIFTIDGSRVVFNNSPNEHSYYKYGLFQDVDHISVPNSYAYIDSDVYEYAPEKYELQ